VRFVDDAARGDAEGAIEELGAGGGVWGTGKGAARVAEKVAAGTGKVVSGTVFVAGGLATLVEVLCADAQGESGKAEYTEEYQDQANSPDPRFNGQPGGFYTPATPSV